MYLCLFGEYLEQKHVQIAKFTQQAAINVLFFVGIAGLVLLVIVLLMESAYMSATKAIRVLVEMRTHFLKIGSASLHGLDDNNRWPVFEHRKQPEFTPTVRS